MRMLMTYILSALTGGEERELFVPKGESKVGLTDISPGKQYVFRVFAMSGRKQSKALQGKYPGKYTMTSCCYCCFCAILCKSAKLVNSKYTLAHTCTLTHTWTLTKIRLHA